VIQRPNTTPHEPVTVSPVAIPGGRGGVGDCVAVAAVVLIESR